MIQSLPLHWAWRVAVEDAGVEGEASRKGAERQEEEAAWEDFSDRGRPRDQYAVKPSRYVAFPQIPLKLSAVDGDKREFC